MNGRHVIVIFMINAFLLSMPTYTFSKDLDYQEGNFKFRLSDRWSRLPSKSIDDMKKNMLSGARELAKASKSADPKDLTNNAIPFLSGFQLNDGSKRILLFFSAVRSDTVYSIEEMYITNQERIEWGIDTGKLKSSSKGVTRLDINGIPCLLQDIETKEGGALRQYSFFASEYPLTGYSIQFICDDILTFSKWINEFASIINSVSIIHRQQK